MLLKKGKGVGGDYWVKDAVQMVKKGQSNRAKIG